MVRRYVFVRLEDQEKERRHELALAAKETLSEQGATVVVGVPADAHADKAWDLSIELGLITPDGLRRFLELPDVARFFAALTTVAKVEKAWNMETP